HAQPVDPGRSAQELQVLRVRRRGDGVCDAVPRAVGPLFREKELEIRGCVPQPSVAVMSCVDDTWNTVAARTPASSPVESTRPVTICALATAAVAKNRTRAATSVRLTDASPCNMRFLMRDGAERPSQAFEGTKHREPGKR